MERVPGRSALDLAVQQVQGIEAWVAEQREVDAAEVVSRTREARLDAERRLQARRREQRAVLARADEHLRQSVQLLGRPARVRAVVAHRSPWLRDRVARGLEFSDVQVTGLFEDGADALGTLVVEQPDLLLVEDRLPNLSGLELVRRSRALSPGTLCGIHAGGDVAAAGGCGADVVFARPVPPADMADELVRLLRARLRPVPA